MKGLSDAAEWAIAKVFDDTFAEIGGIATSLGAADDAVGLPTDTWSLEKFTVDEYNKLYESIKSGELTVDDAVIEKGDIAKVELSNVTLDYIG